LLRALHQKGLCRVAAGNEGGGVFGMFNVKRLFIGVPSRRRHHDNRYHEV
jgi:hypothetical protein